MREIVSGIGNSAVSSSQQEGDLPCWAICLTGLNHTLTDKALVSEPHFRAYHFSFCGTVNAVLHGPEVRFDLLLK